MRTLSLILPFMGAILLFLMAPLLAEQAKRILLGQIAESAKNSEAPPLPDSTPYYLGTPAIADYVDYISDFIQIGPAVLLPIVGSVFSISQGADPLFPLIFLALTAIFAICLSAWMITKTASDYVSVRWFGYSIVSLVGVTMNVFGIVMVVLLS
jgi:hypothetical protein